MISTSTSPARMILAFVCSSVTQGPTADTSTPIPTSGNDSQQKVTLHPVQAELSFNESMIPSHDQSIAKMRGRDNAKKAKSGKRAASLRTTDVSDVTQSSFSSQKVSNLIYCLQHIHVA